MSAAGLLSGYQWSLLYPRMLQRRVLASCRRLPNNCGAGPTVSPDVGSLLFLEPDYQRTKTGGTKKIQEKIICIRFCLQQYRKNPQEIGVEIIIMGL